MALTVENGNGLTNAESYLAEADADTYHTNHSGSTDWSGATTARKEQALRKATQYLDGIYRLDWRGYRKTRDQALAWPRSDVFDQDGYLVDSASLPQALKDATAEAALLDITETDGLAPKVATPGAIKKTVDQVGTLRTEREYQGGAGQFADFPVITRLLAGLVIGDDELLRA